VWTGSKRNKGYGAFVWSGADGEVIQGRAHRFSWELHNGPIPEGMSVLHRCDNPPCVNPRHLFLGTIADNNHDMQAKGRKVPGGTHTPVELCKYERGVEHHAATLTEDIVRSIRQDRLDGMSFGQLRKKYKLSIGHVYRIVKRKAWSHVV